MADLTCKQDNQNFFCRNFNNQSTCISNSKALILIYSQRYKLQNFWMYEPRCTNKVVKEDKEKEKKKNAITLAIYHGTLLATTGDYLRSDILL